MTVHEQCAGYWRECFGCSEYLPDRVFFCRRANLARFGREEVEAEEAENGDGGKAWNGDRGREAGERKSGVVGGAWWNGRRFRARRR